MASISNETYAIQALRQFYGASGIAVYSFDMLLAYYRQQGAFMNGFGAAVRTVRGDKVQAAMEKLGKRASGYPRTEDFFSALAAEAGTVYASDALAAAGVRWLLTQGLRQVVAISWQPRDGRPGSAPLLRRGGCVVVGRSLMARVQPERQS